MQVVLSDLQVVPPIVPMIHLHQTIYRFISILVDSADIAWQAKHQESSSDINFTIFHFGYYTTTSGGR